jgi:hypothetical protein
MLSYIKLAKSPSFSDVYEAEVSEFYSLYKKVESRYDEFEERRRGCLGRTGRGRSARAGVASSSSSMTVS